MIIARLISSGLGSGYFPVAPGTAGSILFAALWFTLRWYTGSPRPIDDLALVGFICAIGWFCVHIALKSESESDPGWIVIDEWAGLALALFGTTTVPPYFFFLAVALFRLFDIWKPGPVGAAERLPGALGIMADDVVAGGLALLVMTLIRYSMTYWSV